MLDMKERYMELYNKMSSSKDVEKMKAFGDAEVWIFGMLADRHPELAQKWLDKLEASEWHNYLSESEAMDVVAGLKSQDGRTGAH